MCSNCDCLIQTRNLFDGTAIAIYSKLQQQNISLKFKDIKARLSIKELFANVTFDSTPLNFLL